ncbi:prefoldin subunit 5 [Exidia glandulosa HHB12029]|uniref:Prefoldin subunit 5 n=1 Tax=Exidia glandulosa HHB12029 TaxID=1314781 RepID=A0A165Q7K4_EXIGL|nr:prefoldin subunit 5 [Exidia glandulosa HHB12029]
MASQQQETVNISDLELPQLADVRRQLNQELEMLTNSYAQLRAAQSKFKACIESVAEITPNNQDKSILVPLTNSLYVPGTLADTEHVVVDVGTGFYVKKTREEARLYYRAKVDGLQGNLDQLQNTISVKQDNVNVVLQIMQAKLRAQGGAPGPSGSKS